MVKPPQRELRKKWYVKSPMRRLTLVVALTVFLFGTITTLLTTGKALAEEDISLEPFKVLNHEKCLEVLAEFNWVCREFERREWLRVNKGSFWHGGSLLVYRSDLDEDGKSDVIITVSAIARCPSGGDLCEHILLFGGEKILDKTRKLESIFAGYPVISNRSGKRGIYFSFTPEKFLAADQVREEMHTGQLFEP